MIRPPFNPHSTKSAAKKQKVDDDDTFSVVEDLSEGGEGSEPNSIEVTDDD
jgi:hypothetical protein